MAQKSATTGSKRPKNTCLSIPSCLGTTLEKNFFSPRGPWWTHRWPPLSVGWPALRLHQVTTGTGVYVSRWAVLRLGNHKKWGVAGGLVPSEFVFEPRSPRYGPFLVSRCWCTLRTFWGFLAPFWALSRTYRGVRGHQRSLGHQKGRPHVECSSRLPSFGCFEPLLGLFWTKNGCFWPKTAQIWEGTSRLGAPAPGRHR